MLHHQNIRYATAIFTLAAAVIVVALPLLSGISNSQLRNIMHKILVAIPRNTIKATPKSTVEQAVLYINYTIKSQNNVKFQFRKRKIMYDYEIQFVSAVIKICDDCGLCMKDSSNRMNYPVLPGSRTE